MGRAGIRVPCKVQGLKNTGKLHWQWGLAKNWRSYQCGKKCRGISYTVAISNAVMDKRNKLTLSF
jgi:hypothetical protein